MFHFLAICWDSATKNTIANRFSKCGFTTAPVALPIDEESDEDLAIEGWECWTQAYDFVTADDNIAT